MSNHELILRSQLGMGLAPASSCLDSTQMKNYNLKLEDEIQPPPTQQVAFCQCSSIATRMKPGMTLDMERMELHLSAHNPNLIMRKLNHAENTCPVSLEPPQVTRLRKLSQTTETRTTGSKAMWGPETEKQSRY